MNYKITKLSAKCQVSSRQLQHGATQRPVPAEQQKKPSSRFYTTTWFRPLVTPVGLEPTTHWLRINCSASWATESTAHSFPNCDCKGTTFFWITNTIPVFFQKNLHFLVLASRIALPNEHYNGQSSQAGRRGAENGRFLCPVSKNKQHVALIFRKNLIFASKQWQGAWSAPGRRGPPPSRKANLQCKFRQKHWWTKTGR